MRCVFLFVSILFAAYIARGQEIRKVEVIITPELRESGEVYYAAKRLSWEDFQGRPDYNCGFAAMTYSGIRIRYEYKTRRGVTSARVFLTPYMDQSKSWYKEGALDPNSTLTHEQGHFDITAMLTSELAAAIRKTRFSAEAFAHDIMQLHKTFMEELRRKQREYDAETNHGLSREDQNAWNRRLESALLGTEG